MVAKWFITTSATATVSSASATFSGEANNLVVSHCQVATTTGSTPEAPGTPGTPGGAEVGGDRLTPGTETHGTGQGPRLRRGLLPRSA